MEFLDVWGAIMATLTVFFTAVGACSTFAYTMILLITAFMLRSELNEMKKSTHASAYKAARDILQDEKIRDARRFVFVNLKDKHVGTWTEKEKLEAEKVCHSYDTVGQLVRYGVLPKEFIVDSWGDSLRKSWRILAPLMISYRVERNSLEMWDDFEWLAKEARAFQKPLYTD